MRKLKIAGIVSLLCLCNLLSGQVQQLDTKAEKTYAVKLGTTLPIKDVAPMTGPNQKKIKHQKSEYKVPKNFMGRFPSRKIEGKDHLPGNDLIRQKYLNKNSSPVVEPIVSIDGLNQNGSPSDPTLGVGKDFVLQAINLTTIGVYNKQGEFITSFSGNSLFGQIGFTSGGDPIIMYDQEFDRWIITEFPGGFGPNANQLLVAISHNSDPLDAYDVYNFPTPTFPDYPKYSIWSNAYAVTTNEGGSAVLHSYFINREELLAGQDTVRMQRVNLPGTTGSEQGFIVATPVSWSGNNKPETDQPIILSLNDASWTTGQEQDEVSLFRLNINWENEDSTQFERIDIPVSPYDGNPCSATSGGFACIPQLSGPGLDGIPEVVMNNPQYRNFGTHESIVLNFVTDVTDGENFAGIRWVELRKMPGEEWDLFQEGTFSPDDGLERFMGGIAIDVLGNIGLAYNVSSEDTHPGIRLTGRRVDDEPGVMTVHEATVVNGEDPVFGGGRFGDYSTMTMDPIDERTFWFTSEYGKGEVSTRIFSFRLASDTFDMGPTVLRSPLTGALSASETVQLEISNFGLEAIDKFSVGYIFQDQDTVLVKNIDTLLNCDVPYIHTFEPAVDMSEIGTYNFKLFTSAELDEALYNDTIDVVVEHLPPFGWCYSFW